MQRQSQQHHQSHLPVEKQQNHRNYQQLENLLPERGDDHHQHIEQRDIADDIADEFTGAVLFIKAQRKTLQMAENFLPDIYDQPDPGIINDRGKQIPQHTARQINNYHGDAQKGEKQIIRRRQNPVDCDFQHPRNCESDHVKYDRQKE